MYRDVIKWKEDLPNKVKHIDSRVELKITRHDQTIKQCGWSSGRLTRTIYPIGNR